MNHLPPEIFPIITTLEYSSQEEQFRKEYSIEWPNDRQCTTTQFSTGKHCPEPPIHKIGDEEYVCDRCYQILILNNEYKYERITQ